MCLLEKTEAIVLKYINFTDSSIICYLLTKDFGKQTYMVRGIRGKNSKTKINLLQPLFILNVDVKHKPKSNIHTLHEFSLSEFYKTIPYDIAKSSIAIFISEILNKTFKDGDEDEELFNFVKTYILKLDELKEDYNNFHIIFLIKLTSFLGFYPNIDNNIYMNSEINKTLSYITEIVLNSDEILPSLPQINSNNRNDILVLLIEYYNIHLQSSINIKSLDVLKSIFL